MNRASYRFAKWGMLPLRIVVGLVFMMHGGQKLFVFGLGGTADIMGKLGLPLPSLAAAIVIVVELLGGLAIVFGAFTRLAGAETKCRSICSRRRFPARESPRRFAHGETASRAI